MSSMNLLNIAVRQSGGGAAAALLTAEVLLLPSADSVGPFGTLSNLENTNSPGGHGLAEMSKDITVRVFNIQGGVPPYTVDFNMTQTCTASKACPNGGAVEEIIAFSPPNQFTGIAAATPITDNSAQLAPSILYTGVGNVPGSTDGYNPNTDNGGCNVTITGSILITDDVGNTLTLAVDGSEGNVTVKTDGTPGNYFDVYLWGDTLCVPL